MKYIFLLLLLHLVTEHLFGQDVSSLTKEDAINLCCRAWQRRVLPGIIKSGFRTSGLFPLNLVQMKKRLTRFLKTEVILPTEPSKKKRRKTVDVGGRILNISMLEEIDAAKVEKGTKGSKAPKMKSSVAVTRPRNRKKNDQAPTRVSKQAQSGVELFEL